MSYPVGTRPIQLRTSTGGPLCERCAKQTSQVRLFSEVELIDEYKRTGISLTRAISHAKRRGISADRILAALMMGTRLDSTIQKLDTL